MDSISILSDPRQINPVIRLHSECKTRLMAVVDVLEFFRASVKRALRHGLALQMQARTGAELTSSIALLRLSLEAVPHPETGHGMVLIANDPSTKGDVP